MAFYISREFYLTFDILSIVIMVPTLFVYSFLDSVRNEDWIDLALMSFIYIN